MPDAVKVVSVDGFGNSGSGAVVDLLREIDGYSLFGDEIRIIKDPDGLIDLETALCENWTEHKPDWALRRFENLVTNLTSFKFKFWEPSLYTHRKFILSRTRQYLNELKSFEYPGHLFLRHYEASLAQYLTRFLKSMANRRLGTAFKHRPIGSTSFVDPKVDFLGSTRRYLQALIADRTEAAGADTVILFMGTSPFQPARSSRYFDNFKGILTDRDPRDIYISAQTSTYLPRDVDHFISWFRATRDRASQAEGCEQVLRVRFEDLVLRYEQNKTRILEFLGVDPGRHTFPGRRFDPSVSSKGVGKWKSYPDQSSIRKIENELEPYLYTDY